MNQIVPWSHSRMSAFELCPRRHYEVDIAKNFDEGPAPARDFGSELHKALELRCRDGEPMPPKFQTYEPVARKVLSLPGEVSYERKLAIAPDFSPTDFFAPDAWLRVVVDVQILDEANGRVGALDYKTGKIKTDPSQLQLNALVLFAHYPWARRADLRYWWIAKGGGFSRYSYHRKDVPDLWSKHLPRAKAYAAAVAAGKFPANPSGICRKWCPVTTCQFHGGA